MALRRPSIGSLERELAELTSSIADTEAEQVRQAELAREASIESRTVSDDAVAFADAMRRAREHGDERRRLGFVLERRRQDLVELEQKLAGARAAEAHEALTSAAERRRDAAGKLSNTTANAVKALAVRDAAHDEYEAALEHARQLADLAGIELELPEAADEPEFPAGVERLVEALQAGPRRPLARDTQGREELRKQTARANASVGAQAAREALRDGSFERMGRLTPMQRAAAVRVAERMAPDLVQNDRQHEAVERRLKRLRELATEVETAA